VNFRFEVDAWGPGGVGGGILGGGGWLLFCCGFLNGVFDNFLVGGSWVFVDFGVEGLVRKLANCFLLVEVGAPGGCRAAFVGCFDGGVISVFEIDEVSPFFFGGVGGFGVAIRF